MEPLSIEPIPGILDLVVAREAVVINFLFSPLNADPA